MFFPFAMKKTLWWMMMLLWIVSFWFAGYSTTPSNEFFICDGLCPSSEYSLWNTDKGVHADIAKYNLNYVNTVYNLLRETDLYKKLKKEYKQDPNISQSLRIDADDPILWGPKFNIIKQMEKLSVGQVADTLGIKNYDSIRHIQNINLFNMYYNSLDWRRWQDFSYARSLTTGIKKSMTRYKNTYKNTKVSIGDSRYRDNKDTFIQKDARIYYFPVTTCITDSIKGQNKCEVYGVIKQIINWKIKNISSKLLQKYIESDLWM